MNISNELLAAYAENNVSPEERQEVRQYLTDHPSELESVMMMMDDDYDLEPQNKAEDLDRVISINQNALKTNPASDLKLRVADFAPRTKGNYHISRGDIADTFVNDVKRQSTFNSRLDNLLDELGV